jgi:hypothetical protein
MSRLAQSAPVRLVGSLLGLALAVLAVLAMPATATAAPVPPIEEYSSYQPQTTCRPQAKPGTKYLGRWLVRTYGGGFGPISRACGGGTSEHTEGRAFDWMLDASRRANRRRAHAFLAAAFRTDRRGNTDALARRTGIMYVIWNDRIFSAWNEFEPEPYLSSGCKSRRTCSTTLRHRDHVHISLSRKGGRGATSWYDGRLPRS